MAVAERGFAAEGFAAEDGTGAEFGA